MSCAARALPSKLPVVLSADDVVRLVVVDRGQRDAAFEARDCAAYCRGRRTVGARRTVATTLD